MLSRSLKWKLVNGLEMVAEKVNDTLVQSGLKKCLPRIFAIEINVACNLRCPECPLGGGGITRKCGQLSFEQFKIIADKTRPYSKLMYIMLWGEPLLNRQLIEMISYASSFTKTSISTNGMLLTPEMAEALVTSGLGQLIMSIDGVSQEVYGQYRVGGDSARAFDALRLVHEMNEKHGGKVEIIPQFIVFKHNEHEMELFAQICADIGLAPSFKAPYLRRKGVLQESENPKYVRQKYPDMAAVREAMRTCQNPLKVFTTLLDGSVVACCYDYNGITNFGNIFEKDVLEIWDAPAYASFRKRTMAGDAPSFCTEQCLMYTCGEGEEGDGSASRKGSGA